MAARLADGAGGGRRRVAALDALCQAAASGRPYPLVLLDARMPDTDGLALADQDPPATELSATRIILLTSGDRPGDPARARELRIDAQLLKPVQQDELLETICRVMSRSSGECRAGGRSRGEEQTDQLGRSGYRSRCASWWPRTTSSTRSSWSSCSGVAATTCGWRATAARRWTLAGEQPSTCCSWTSTCRNWTASRSSRRFASASGRRGATCPSSP